MIVVADTSPLIGLVKIGFVHVLHDLYGSVVIPAEVAAELSAASRPVEVRDFALKPPGWLSVRSPADSSPIGDLDPGECAAIHLARELRADLLLIDENQGRRVAMDLGIRTARTAAVLFDAANAGAISDLRNAFERLKATNFRVPPKVLDELLALHLKMRDGS